MGARDNLIATWCEFFSLPEAETSQTNNAGPFICLAARSGSIPSGNYLVARSTSDDSFTFEQENWAASHSFAFLLATIYDNPLRYEAHDGLDVNNLIKMASFLAGSRKNHFYDSNVAGLIRQRSNEVEKELVTEDTNPYYVFCSIIKNRLSVPTKTNKMN